MSVRIWDVIEANRVRAAKEWTKESGLRIPVRPPPAMLPPPPPAPRVYSTPRPRLTLTSARPFGSIPEEPRQTSRVRRKRKQKQVLPDPGSSSSSSSSTAKQSSENVNQNLPQRSQSRKSATVGRRVPDKVSFAPTVRIRVIRTIHDFTDDEVNELWYGSDDIASIREENIFTVRMAVKGLLDTKRFCFRGLEHKTRTGAALRKANRVQGVSKTVTYYRLQMNLGLEDAEYLAKMYGHASFLSRQAALDQGKEDEFAAKQILGEA